MLFIKENRITIVTWLTYVQYIIFEFFHLETFIIHTNIDIPIWRLGTYDFNGLNWSNEKTIKSENWRLTIDEEIKSIEKNQMWTFTKLLDGVQ